MSASAVDIDALLVGRRLTQPYEQQSLARITRKAKQYDELLFRLLDGGEPKHQELALKMIREAGQP
jgi:hypothetical protein